MSESNDSTDLGIKILIVDDLANVREELAEVLQLTTDFNVVGTAANNVQAIKKAELLKPDIVILDVELPGLDGFYTAQQLKDRQLARAVIMLSIHSRLQYQQRSEEVGVDAYVEKGEGIDSLTSTIHRIWQKWLNSSSVSNHNKGGN